jgi:hypothetical protein
MVETRHATDKWRMLGIRRELLVDSLGATRVMIEVRHVALDGLVTGLLDLK